jgi:DNA-binding phage protein
MERISKNRRLTAREIHYFRQRQKNRVFQSVVAYFADQAERYGLTKSSIADSLGKDRSQISRWFSGPGNWGLDTVSDLLLAMGAEMDHDIVSLNEPVVRAANVRTIAPPINTRTDPLLVVGTRSTTTLKGKGVIA